MPSNLNFTRDPLALGVSDRSNQLRGVGVLAWNQSRLDGILRLSEKTYLSREKVPEQWKMIARMEGIEIKVTNQWQISKDLRQETDESRERSLRNAYLGRPLSPSPSNSPSLEPLSGEVSASGLKSSDESSLGS